jgi:hypothetical protein
MILRLASSGLPAATLAVLLGVGTLHGQTSGMTGPVPAGENPARVQAPRRGNLFSAVSLADSSLGREWSRLRPEALARFPELRLSETPDLHLTVVYIGGNWKEEDLDRIRSLALIAPATPERLAPEVVRLGAQDQVVAVELHAASPAWGEAVVAAKHTLNRLGLKQPESYDSNFRSHLTLAEAKHFPPSPAEADELAAFSSWLSARVAQDPAKFTVTVGPRTPVRLLLSNLPRAQGAPAYVPLEDFLRRPPAPPAGP